jgi:hypothetical protein
MFDFARRTGLIAPADAPVRYLWTDAFAVCNFVGLFVAHQDQEALDLALQLVDQAHHVLGRHRPDDARLGWISGLSEEDGEAHPTRCGLRIGKPLRERGPGEPSDPSQEWQRDGQYFHYLTRWMHALDRVAGVTGDATYHRWACELARGAFAGFTHASVDGAKGLIWKMSIGLDRPQIASTGQHDPLDGFITYCQLQARSDNDSDLDLGHEICELAGLCAGRSWDTDDALGIGGLLRDAQRLIQLRLGGTLSKNGLLEAVLVSSRRGLAALASQAAFRGSAERRLAFRELGLSIGLHAAEGIQRCIAEPRRAFVLEKRFGTLLDDIAGYAPLARQIERFWLDPAQQQSPSWREHRDINDVMLATSLSPGGYLELPQ